VKKVHKIAALLVDRGKVFNLGGKGTFWKGNQAKDDQLWKKGTL